MEAAHAIIGVAANGSVDSTAIRWVTQPPYPAPAAGPFAGVGAIPRDGSLYYLSGNGKFLLVLRLMPHSANVRGETGNFGLLDYFDVSNPKRPHRIGPTLEADGPCTTARSLLMALASQCRFFSRPPSAGWARALLRLSGRGVVFPPPRLWFHGPPQKVSSSWDASSSSGCSASRRRTAWRSPRPRSSGYSTSATKS